MIVETMGGGCGLGEGKRESWAEERSRTQSHLGMALALRQAGPEVVKDHSILGHPPFYLSLCCILCPWEDKGIMELVRWNLKRAPRMPECKELQPFLLSLAEELKLEDSTEAKGPA